MKNRSATSLVAVIVGAICTATNPIFVRFSELEPVVSAFHRILWALPILLLWTYISKTPKTGAVNPTDRWLLVICGVCFAGDLLCLHLAIDRTFAANAIVFLNAQPIYVVIFAWLFFAERVSRNFVIAMLIAFVGVASLMWSGNKGAGNLLGDALGIAAGIFYAGFLLAASRLRRRHSSMKINVWTCLVALPILFVVAIMSAGPLLPSSFEGWGYMLALGIVSHALGQGLIVWGLAQLATSMSALVLLVAPIAAAGFAWVLLGESLNLAQILSALVVLVAIQLAWRGSREN
jgi:drug/metabolite transporter (DMT)-like permease